MAKPSKRVFKLGITGRPGVSDASALMSERPRAIHEKTSVSLEELYDVAQRCNAVRKSIQALRDYIFKKGTRWVPKYSRRCRNCDTEFPAETAPEFCSECDHGRDVAQVAVTQPPNPFDAQGDVFGYPAMKLAKADLVRQLAKADLANNDPARWYDEPDEDVTRAADRFFKKVDRNGHTLIEVLKMFEDHLNTADTAFLCAIQNYAVSRDGAIVGTQLLELYAGDPRSLKMVADPATMIPGGRWFICLKHRPRGGRGRYNHYNFDKWQEGQPQGRVYERPGRCEESGCGKKLRDVWYVSLQPGARGDTQSDVLQYYVGPDGDFPGEVICTSKYSIAYGPGYAPLVSVFDQARLLISQERYMRTFYDEERAPRVAIFIPTKSAKSVQSVWKAAEDRNVSQGGHYIPKFTYDPGEGKVGVEVKEFSKLPEELQYIEVRDECYRRIGSAFGIAPVFHGNVDAVGLQSQGPTQWQVTTDAATLAQWVYNEKVFPALMQLMGIKDWDLRLEEVEDEDEVQKWDAKMAEADYALMMQQLGYAPTGRDLEGHFIFPSQPQQSAMGMMGLDMGPMGPPGGGSNGDPPPPGSDEPPPGEPGGEG